MRIAVLTSRFPYPLEKGDKLRVYRHIQYLSTKHEVYLFSLTHKHINEEDYEALQPYCKKIFLYRIHVLKLIWNLIAGIFQKKPLSTAYFADSHCKARMQIDLEASRPDSLYCQLIRMAYYVPSNFRGFKLIDYMDAFSLIADKRAKTAGFLASLFWKREASLLSALEKLLLSQFDHATFISERDRNVIVTSKKAHTSVISNGIDILHFHPDKCALFLDDIPRAELVFVGNMGYHPNVLAAVILVRKILPLLPDHYKVNIAGARPSPEVRGLASERVNISGWVDDIRSAYASANIFIAPIFHGSGQQNKILEAMSMGMACITTHRVNEAIGAKDGVEILCADTPEGFADCVKKLEITELRLEIGKAARMFVARHYPWEKTNLKLLEVMAKHANEDTVNNNI